MTSEKIELIVGVIGIVGITIATFVYYSTPRLCTCNRCGAEISHRKRNRYFEDIDGKEHAVCQRCYSKANKPNSKSPIRQDNATKTTCYCCNYQFKNVDFRKTWVIDDIHRETCRKCTREIESEEAEKLDLSVLISEELLRKFSNFNKFDELLTHFGKQINCKEDLKSKEWNDFIVANTNFRSWEAMETVALKYAQNRFLKRTTERLRAKYK